MRRPSSCASHSKPAPNHRPCFVPRDYATFPVRFARSILPTHSSTVTWLSRTLSIVLARHCLNQTQTPTELQIATVVGRWWPQSGLKNSTRTCRDPSTTCRRKSGAPIRRGETHRRGTQRREVPSRLATVSKLASFNSTTNWPATLATHTSANAQRIIVHLLYICNEHSANRKFSAARRPHSPH